MRPVRYHVAASLDGYIAGPHGEYDWIPPEARRRRRGAGRDRGTGRRAARHAPPSFASGPLAPMLPAFLARHPEVRVVLSFDNAPIVHLPDDVDVAIRAGPRPDSDLIARRLASRALCVCASPGYLAAHGTPATSRR